MEKEVSLTKGAVGIDKLAFLTMLLAVQPGWGAVTEVHNGRELALAFANNSVTTILMASDIHLLEADWVGLPSPVPVVLTRDITVVSQPGLSYLIDFNYISRKVRGSVEGDRGQGSLARARGLKRLRTRLCLTQAQV